MLFAFIFPVLSLICDRYKCSPSPLPQGVCISFNKATFLLQTCPDSQYCPPIDNTSTQYCLDPPAPDYRNGYPGDYCQKNNQCISLSCLSNNCQGKNQLQSCTSSIDCGVGLSCRSNLCQSLVLIGSSGCITDYDCQLEGFCNQGKCDYLFTKQVGEQIEFCGDSGISFDCQLGACENIDGKSFCVSPEKSAQVLPIRCDSDTDCTGKSGKLGKCVCGFNQDGQSYCEAFIGDSPGVLYLERGKTYLNSSVLKNCHTLRRYSERCAVENPSEESTGFVTAKAYFEEYATFVNNDECVFEIFHEFAGGLMMTTVYFILN